MIRRGLYIVAILAGFALCSLTSVKAAAYLNGRTIRPHSIPLNRLVRMPASSSSSSGLHLVYVAGGEYVVQPGQTGFSQAVCPRGQIAVSGGFSVVAEVAANQIVGLTSEPMEAAVGWVAGFQDTGTTPATVVSYALCTPGSAKAASS